MRLFFALLLCYFVSISHTDAQCGKRYQERYFNSIQVFRDVVYSKDAPALIGTGYFSEIVRNKDLVMDIFMPPVTDTVKDRPVVILAHSGGFVNLGFMGNIIGGTMNNTDIQALADTLAHWGYVTASIEYRLGYNPANTASFKRAVWRGTQDMSAAMRFFRKNAHWFKVDPDKIFTGGSSAGGIASIHSSFLDWNERIPESYQLIPFLQRDLGSLHSRPVVELNGFNPFYGQNVLGNDVDSIATAIASYWGAVGDLDWISQGQNQAPIIMFHGTGDIIVDHECKRPFSGLVLTAPVTCGASAMAQRLAQAQRPHELHLTAGPHEYWGALNGNWLPGGPNAYWRDIIDKTTAYFYQVMQPAAPSISGPSNVMPGINYSYQIANPDPSKSYCWEVEGGVIVSPVTNGSSILVQFYGNSSQGAVHARAVDRSQVASEAASLATQVRVLRQATNTNNTVTLETGKTAELSAQLFPNPMSTQGQLVVESSTELEAQLVLNNLLGQVVWQQPVNITAGQQQIELPVQTLDAGTYSLSLVYATGQWTKRLIIRK